MDKRGSLELKILKSFEAFSDVFEKIQNKPEFKQYQKNGVNIPKYESQMTTTFPTLITIEHYSNTNLALLSPINWLKLSYPFQGIRIFAAFNALFNTLFS